jgi:predicted small secreted protein
MKKRILAIFLVCILIMSVTLAGCEKKEGEGTVGDADSSCQRY